jgi:hypothetical protein
MQMIDSLLIYCVIISRKIEINGRWRTFALENGDQRLTILKTAIMPIKPIRLWNLEGNGRTSKNGYGERIQEYGLENMLVRLETKGAAIEDLPIDAAHRQRPNFYRLR